MRPYQQDIDAMRQAVDKYVIEKYEAGDGYESDTWKATKVVGHDRSWNLKKLEKIVPRGILKNVLKISVDAKKLDELVKAGRIDRDEIEDAFEEKPKAPYVKITRKESKTDKAAEEAASLAEKLA